MKIVRAPLRISLFGGGSDLEPYCSKYGSTIISFAINRYMYLTWNERPTGGCRVSYSKVEEIPFLAQAEHTLVRQAAVVHGIAEPCTLTIVSDVPKGTGLGSSSALAVCLIRLVYPECDLNTLWRWAAEVEHSVSSAGWQDYLPPTYGNFASYRIGGAGTRFDAVLKPAPFLCDIINTYGLLLYTGDSRPADSVLGSWKKSEAQLHDIKAIADEVAERIDEMNVTTLAQYLNATWHLKKSISGVSNDRLNWFYTQAMANGALGGKLCGAGAGGCWFFLVPPDGRAKVVEALGLREIPFQIAEKGVEMWEL